MSSNCSINCCSSPEVTSSNVSVSNMNGIVSNDTTGNRIRTTVPETKKDNKYWERRRRNNEAARRSREKRRQNDMVMDKRILELSQRNKQLENEIFQLKMNFGLVNNNQSKLELEESNNKLISPTTVHETKTNNSADDHINGMVFPVFTAFSSGTEIPEIIEKTNTEGLNKSIVTSKVNECPKTCINANKYQSNLINLGNIPLLSNLISTPNLDITSKATLLLPTLLPKPTMKSLDPSTSSGVFNNNAVLDVDKLTFTSTPDVCHDQKKRSETIDQLQISPGANVIKMDFQDILDLSLKQENAECFFINTNGSSDVFSRRHIVSNDGFIVGNKDTITRSSPENQSMEESMTNSFLSGILSTSSKDRLSDVMQRKPFTTAHISTRINNNKIRRHNPFNDHVKKLPCQNSNRWSSANSVHHDLSLKTRLSIRREVSTIVISENRKLRQDIDRLSNEIKFLKSAMLECAKLTVTKPMANHNSQSIHDRQPLDKTENSELVFAQFTATTN